MQQLTLQFEGYADSRQVIDVHATKERTLMAGRSHAGNGLFQGWKLVVPTLGTVTVLMARAKALAPSVVLYDGQAAAAVTFVFGMMYLAAISKIVRYDNARH